MPNFVPEKKIDKKYLTITTTTRKKCREIEANLHCPCLGMIIYVFGNMERMNE